VDETTWRALQLLRAVKSVTFATLNDGQPAARIIDVMLVDETGLHFLSARGKSFYAQLGAGRTLAICGMDERYVSVRIVGDFVPCNDRSVVDKIFEHNPVMNDLYPGETRDILEAFHVYRGKGEIFDLSVEPPKRERFAFGGAAVNPVGYRITGNCSACGICLDACPVGVISAGDIYVIDGSHCLECGRCAELCPEAAIKPAPGL
jgi:uncharacterized pyridoxamine 5'-phosphate oxidase family protein/NAD-dependent dihydropyrimidine dehydrogenase PreA subunit